jgi:hypothetical protein
VIDTTTSSACSSLGLRTVTIGDAAVAAALAVASLAAARRG